MDILVFSEDMMERTVMQQVLEHSGHKVWFVENVREGWERMRENGVRFVIIDAARDGENLHQLVQNMRDGPGLPGQTYILLLTVKGQGGKLVSSLGDGIDDILYKPVSPQELKSRVSLGERILSLGETLQQAREQMETLAMYDTLTGLMNRHAFYKVAEGELERARRGADGLSVIALDVDNFREINAEYGQAVGDDALKIVAAVIREKSRPYDCIGRWDGDQFTIVLPGVVSTDAEKITRRILSGVRASEISLANGPALGVKLSAGIASSQTINAYTEIETFIQSAVAALHAAMQSEEEEISLVFV